MIRAAFPAWLSRYATSPRGACHNQSDYFFVDWGHTQPEIGIDFFGRHAGAEKSANVAHHQDWRTVYNAMVMCIFANVAPQMQVDSDQCSLRL